MNGVAAPPGVDALLVPSAAPGAIPQPPSLPPTPRRASAVVESILRESLRDGDTLLEDVAASGADASSSDDDGEAAPVRARGELPGAAEEAGRFTKWGLGGFEFVSRESTWNRVLRWPLLGFIFAMLLADAVLYLLVRLAVVVYEDLIVWRGKSRRLRDAVHSARTYAEFKAAARELDAHLGNEAWKRRVDSLDHDADTVIRTARRLDKYRARGDLRRLREVLLHGALKPNHGGVENPGLYSHTYWGTKHGVERFVASTIAALDYVSATPYLSAAEKRDFFRKAAHQYGRSALLLSGGAGLGYYHLGVLDALISNDCLPDVITGTSAGSLIAAMVGVRTLDEIRRDILTPELHRILTACSEPWTVRIRRYFREGALFDINDWYSKMSVVTGHITFLEAFQKTGRVLNVSVVPEEPGAPPKLLNYVTAPDVLVASAVLASSAVPGILKPVELQRKTASGRVVPFKGAGKWWRDGSLRVDIPGEQLHRLFNVNYSVVSQVNPHVGLFFYERRGAAGVPTAHRGGRGWRGGFILATLEHHLKLDMIKWANLLRDMSLLPRYMGVDPSLFFLQNFEGNLTIVPRSTLTDYLFLLDDPSRDRLVSFFRGGQRAAFPKVHAVSNRLRIEQAVARGRAAARREAREERRAARTRGSDVAGVTSDGERSVDAGPGWAAMTGGPGGEAQAADGEEESEAWSAESVSGGSGDEGERL
ncbi:acyl transferase/acyl hydrolase/lysophospholipase [Hyaloraphidium curvatum]|nr:acyl transferase/acyl hydrolase/lysophospholipase [Hyaloraphidium curvatum]